METWLFILLSFFLLVLGLLIGYQVASKKILKPKSSNLPVDTKHRLQLLFDSYTDESIDRFIQSLKVSTDTLPLHLSIGKHFRTQGEVEKAILVHQNLLSHPELNSNASESIIYELAKDYKAAGLFDRAQSLLYQLRKSKQFAIKSLRLLLEVNESEKDWSAALKQALTVDLKKHKDIALKVSQYHCEIASQYKYEGLIRESLASYKQALSVCRECYRARLGLAEVSFESKNYSETIQYIKSFISVSPEQTPLVLPLLLKVTQETNTFRSHQQYLLDLLDKTGQIPVMLAIVESMSAEGDSKKAAKFIYEHLHHSPSIIGLNCFFKLYSSSEYAPNDVILIMLRVLDMVQFEQKTYRCISCGFSSIRLQWHCPGCKSWQTIKPIIEYENGISEIKAEQKND